MSENLEQESGSGVKIEIFNDDDVHAHDSGGEEPQEQEEGEALEEDVASPEDDIEGADEPSSVEKKEAKDKESLPITYLRKSLREKARENEELKSRLAQIGAAQEQVQVALGAKPTLEDCDFDDKVFDQRLSGWYDKKIALDAQKAREDERRRLEDQAWQARIEQYNKLKTEFDKDEYEDAENIVKSLLSQAQQGILVRGLKNPARFVAAIGSSPMKAEALAKLKDPIDFAFAVAKMEQEMASNTTKRNAPPPPEKTVSGSGRLSGSSDAAMERLMARAEKTGDYTAAAAYRSKLKKKQ